MECVIISPQEKKMYTEVDSITCRTPKGEIGILKNHAEMLFLIQEGVLITFMHKEDKYVEISKGYGHVLNNVTTFIVS